MAYIYPELSTPFGQTPPTFPETCPGCGSAVISRGEFFHPISYACGGSYDEKPQIQNHTDIWWGRCPTLKEASA